MPTPRRRLKVLIGRIFGEALSDRHGRISLRAKFLIGGLLLGTLPLIVASIILPMRVQSTLTVLGHEHLIQVAGDLATLTQNDIEEHLEMVRSLANIKALDEALLQHNAGTLDREELAATNRQLGALLRGLASDYQGIFLCAADGFFAAGVLKTGETAPYVTLDVRDRPYFAAVRDTLRPVVSDPMHSKVSGVPIIVIVAPIKDADGKFAGCLGLSIEIEHLAAIIGGQKLGKTGYPFAIDRHGLIVAHPDPERAFSLNLAQVPGAAELAAQMRRGETGIMEYVSSKGAHKLAAFAPVPIAGWSIAASIETAEFAAPAQHLRLIIYAMIGACLVIAAVISVIFAVGLEELKRALSEAQASEARFKLFAGVANETIWDWNLLTDELWWSEGVTTAFGYAADEVGKNSGALFERIPESDRDRVAQGIRGCLSGSDWVGEHPFRRRDGSHAYVIHRTVAVRDAKGRAVRVVGGMTDISARRAAEEKLAEQAALLDQTRDGILVRDLNQVIQFWNRGAESLYGWTSAEAAGRRVDELLRVDAASFAEAGRLVLQNGEWFGQLTKMTKEGKALISDCRWTLLRDEQGQPKSILSIDTDITERRQMEARFLRAQRLESIGTLAGGIAHDLNNLLSPIVLGVEMLKLSGPSEEDQQVIQYIEKSATRGTELVKQVLSFARGIEGARVSVHVGYVVREVEAIARSTFPKNITLRVEIPKDLWLVTADPSQLNQVLMNLCVNARDAMPAGGQLTVTARNLQRDEHMGLDLHRELSPGLYVLVEVADTGTGMTKEVLERLFEPFFTTKGPGKGTGLGLSTVIGITRNHGGTVNVYSEPGKGSVFKVYLPASLEAIGGAEVSAPVALPQGRGELILLVDDESVILGVTKQTLERFGYKVLIATDGAQAFALYHQHRTEIALVLTDMMMPVMDGVALIAALRQSDPDVIVVAASGLNDNNNQIKAAEAEIRHFLCKPYTTEALLSVVRAALTDAPVD